MRAGRLRHRVQVQAHSETTDRFGQRNKAWTTIASRYARIEPLTGRELEKARAVRSDLTHRITMRAGLAIDPMMRLFFRGRAFEIESVADLDERGRELVILCKEVVGGS